MRALQKTGHRVTLSHIPTPKTDTMNNVLVKVHFAGICRTDLKIASGDIPAPDPLVLGHEFAGTVADASPSSGFSVGDTVGCNPMAFQSSQGTAGLMCGKDRDGCFAEYIAAPASALVRLPASLLSQRGAFLEPLAAALAPLNAPLPRNTTIAVSGSNRIAALMLKVLRLKGFNAEPLGKATYSCIIETDPTCLKTLVDKLHPGGLLVLKSRFFHDVPVCINDIVMKDIRIFGTSYGSFAEAASILAGDQLNLDDIFGRTFTLDDFSEAFSEAQSESGKIFFRMI